MKHYNTKELENLHNESMKLHDKISKIWRNHKKGHQAYTMFLKVKSRAFRRLNKLIEHRAKIREQEEMLDKAEDKLLENVKKSNAGRPKKEGKKIPVGVKLPPWLNDWMNRQPESKAVLIETALINYYQIPDNLHKS